ncbi:hypothetical protein BD779DRAFT_520911 [Infundibulicybe gibba]|nr:hypothetical protein BD779DRAFT_520911 [Infundibulicybe gibba]
MSMHNSPHPSSPPSLCAGIKCETAYNLLPRCAIYGGILFGCLAPNDWRVSNCVRCLVFPNIYTTVSSKPRAIAVQSTRAFISVAFALSDQQIAWWIVRARSKCNSIRPPSQSAVSHKLQCILAMTTGAGCLQERWQLPQGSGRCICVLYCADRCTITLCRGLGGAWLSYSPKGPRWSSATLTRNG